MSGNSPWVARQLVRSLYIGHGRTTSKADTQMIVNWFSLESPDPTLRILLLKASPAQHSLLSEPLRTLVRLAAEWWMEIV